MCASPTWPGAGPRVVCMLTFTVPLAKFYHLKLLQDAPMLCKWLENPSGSPQMLHRSVDVKIVGQKSALRIVSCNLSASSSNLLATRNKKSPSVRRAQLSKQEQFSFGREKHEGWESSSSNPFTWWEVPCPVWVKPTEALLYLPSAPSHCSALLCHPPSSPQQHGAHWKRPKSTRNHSWASARAPQPANLQTYPLQWELWVQSALENLAVNPQSTPFVSVIGCGA